MAKRAYGIGQAIGPVILECPDIAVAVGQKDKVACPIVGPSHNVARGVYNLHKVASRVPELGRIVGHGIHCVGLMAVIVISKNRWPLQRVSDGNQTVGGVVLK
jgi:hypothetical protein